VKAKTKAERREASRKARGPKGPKPERRQKSLQEAYKPRAKAIDLIPRTPTQARYIDTLYTDGIDIIFAVGPAGTGKTFIPALYGIREYKDAGFKKLVITRPIIPNGEDLGFLPGDLIEKMAPWLRPILDAFGKAGMGQPEITHLIEKGVVEIAPLEMMRGRTFEDTLVIADEMQNATQSQMKMLLTRLGENSQMVITGDLEQRDRADDECGLLDFLSRLESAPRSKQQRIRVIEFDVSEVVRHPVIGDVIAIYG
jgi:phosphate starvation-inducible protein PhoH and related proteins